MIKAPKYNIKPLMEHYGETLIDYLKWRKQRLVDRQILGANEFETVVNAARIEGAKQELTTLITDLEQF